MKRHFYDYLLNQLNCISSMAAMENAKGTQKEIIHLTEYIRYKFGRKNGIIKLEDELMAVHNLISLYQSRMGDNLKYTEEIDKGAQEIYLPHFTIMTFVENCLNHAFGSKEGVSEIRLSVNQDHEGYIIQIEDNGEGFDGFHYFINGEVPGSSLSSIIRKLHEYYDSQTEIVVFNSNRQGTTVQLRVLK